MLNAANRLWGLVLLSATLIHAVIALELWQARDPLTPTASQIIIYKYIPDDVWPVIFGICSITAFFGLWYMRLAQVHFVIAGSLMFIWAIVALVTALSPIVRVGGILLLHISLLKYSLAYYAPKLHRVHDAAVNVIKEVGLIEEQLASKEHLGGK